LHVISTLTSYHLCEVIIETQVAIWEIVTFPVIREAHGYVPP